MFTGSRRRQVNRHANHRLLLELDSPQHVAKESSAPYTLTVLDVVTRRRCVFGLGLRLRFRNRFLVQLVFRHRCRPGVRVLAVDASGAVSHQWQLDVLSIPNYVIKKGRPHGARHVKMMHRRSTSQPIMRGRDFSKRVLKEFTIAFRKI